MGLETSSRRHLHLFALLSVWLAALWMWRSALNTFFTSDDLVALTRAAGLEPTPWTFRPLSAVLAARLEFSAFGLEPMAYHAVNMGLHLLAVAGVYALALQLGLAQGASAAAACIFAGSGIAFTPLYAASGIGDLLACALLLAATLLHLEGRRRDRALWLWTAAATAVFPALAKESPAAWPLVVFSLECRRGLQWRAITPALVAGTVTVLWFAVVTQASWLGPASSYALTFVPAHLAFNLATYLRWCVEPGAPMRDIVAAVNPSSWPAALAVAIAITAAIRWERHRSSHPIEFGVSWLLAFLLPALPLAHHTYLYYLYIPWVGGSIAAAAAGAALARASETPGNWRSLPAKPVTLVALSALALFVLVEDRGVRLRERLTFDALPADPTLRESTLLRHALTGLRAASLPPGIPVGFVNPVPRPAFELPGPFNNPGDIIERREYVPLEAALRGGRALQLFVPGLVDSGFAVTIPAGWERVECFLYEQRGWLRYWGHGQEAFMRQGEFQAASERWASAESSFARVRALGDTMPTAICGQAVALVRLGRAHYAAALVDTFRHRWPSDARAQLLSSALLDRRTDPRLIRPFDTRLPAGAER